MRRFAVLVIAVFLLGGCQKDEPSASNEVTTGGIAYTRLYIPEASDIAIQIAWPTGWPTRANSNKAVPHIGAELLLAGGAEGMAPGEAGEDFADMDVEARLLPLADNIIGTLISPKEHLDKAITIANAHLRAPALDEGWLKRISEGLRKNLIEAASRPADKGFEAFRWAILGDSPLRHYLSADLAADAATVTREDIAAWHRETLVRDGIRIVIAGAITADEAGDAIDRLLAGLPAGPAMAAAKTDANFKPRRILLHIPDAEKSMLGFAAPLPPTREGGESDDFILATALGGNEKSVLFDAVRTRLRASYSFGAGLDGFSRDLRILTMTGEVDTENLSDAVEAVTEAYDAFRQAGPSGSLDDLKAPFIASAKETQTLPGRASFSLLMGLLDGEDPQVFFELASWFEEVSPASLKTRLSDVYPRSEDFVVVAVSPSADALPGACIITEPKQAASCP